MADDIGGVWRTIGGRRVFIKTGYTLHHAMIESGKFKRLKNITPKPYKGIIKEEGTKRYFENEDGSKIEYLKPKEYDKMCEDFNNSLTDEERKRVLDYVDSPMYGASSELNSQPSKEKPGYIKYAYNKNPDNLVTKYERDKKDGRNSEQIEGMKKDSKYIEHNQELYDLRMQENAEYKALREKIPDTDKYYSSKEYQAIRDKYDKIIDTKAKSYGLATGRSEYYYQRNIDYFKLKDTYYSDDDLEYISTYQHLQNIRQGKTANQATDTVRRGKTAIRDQNEMDKIFNEKGIVLDKDIIVYRRSHEDSATVKNGFTKLGYTSTTAKSTLPKTMPSGMKFGETELEIIVPKGTKILPLKGVIQSRYDKIQNKDIDDIKNEKWLRNQAEILLPRETKFDFVSSDGGKYVNYNIGYKYRYTVVADTSASKNFKYKSKKLVNGEWEYEY
jgi:hypothetical protein